ncbi:MAG: aldehyde dehydrogenase family protein [Phycisphaerae bacterium]|nr:aldehyde dehydrogenase family protein [Phycisphaerae bacterium]
MSDHSTVTEPSVSTSGREIISPLTQRAVRARLGGRELVEIRPTQPDDLPAVYTAARAAQKSWQRTSLAERLELISGVYRQLYAHRQDVAATITDATGKPESEALLTEVHNTLDACAFLLNHASRVLSPKRLPAPFLLRMMGYKATVRRKPHGVMTKVSAFNYPFKFAFDAAVFGVVAGNAVVIKPDWSVSHPATLVQWLFEEAGAPRDVVQTIYGKGLGRYVVQQDMDYLSFTGGTDTAQKIWRNLPRPIPISFELGGMDPFIVLPDADLHVVSRALLWGRLIACGQTRVASKRAIVVDDPPGRAEEFGNRMAKLLASVRLAEDSPTEYDVGPVITHEAAGGLNEQLDRVRATGAKCLYEAAPGRAERPSLWLVPPSARENQPLLQEEFFGPIMCVIPAASESEAIELANRQQYGLGSSVFGRDGERAHRVAGELDAGMKWVNNVVTTTGGWPWTGCKSSGPGHALGAEGLLAMTRPEVTVSYRGHDLMSMPHVLPYDTDHRRMVESMISACHAPGFGTRMRGWLGMLNATRKRLRTIGALPWGRSDKL